MGRNQQGGLGRWGLEGWEACAVMKEMPVEDGGPICAEVGSFPRFSVEGMVLDMDKHCLLDGPGMAVNFFVFYVELFCVYRMS